MAPSRNLSTGSRHSARDRKQHRHDRRNRIRASPLILLQGTLVAQHTSTHSDASHSQTERDTMPPIHGVPLCNPTPTPGQSCTKRRPGFSFRSPHGLWNRDDGGCRIMIFAMTKEDIYRELARQVLTPASETEDVLLLMLIFCRYHILFEPSVSLSDVSPQFRPVQLAPQTHWGAANAVAAVWPPNVQRGRDDFWYSAFQEQMPYQDISEVPEPLQRRLTELLSRLQKLPLVNSLIEDL